MPGQIQSIFHHSEWVKFYLHILRAKPAPVPSSPINAYVSIHYQQLSISNLWENNRSRSVANRLYGVSQSQLRRAELTPKLNFQACGLLLTKRVLVEIFPMAVSFIKPPVPATCLSCFPWSHLSSWLHLSPGGRRLRALSVGLFPYVSITYSFI